MVWSISCDLLGAAICGKLPELSETDAERSTGVPLLSTAESNYHVTEKVTGSSSSNTLILLELTNKHTLHAFRHKLGYLTSITCLSKSSWHHLRRKYGGIPEN